MSLHGKRDSRSCKPLWLIQSRGHCRDRIRLWPPAFLNRPGFAQIAFEVGDVEKTLADILAAEGGQVGETVAANYSNGKKAVFVYARDPEGNIIELQSRSRRARPGIASS